MGDFIRREQGLWLDQSPSAVRQSRTCARFAEEITVCSMRLRSRANDHGNNPRCFFVAATTDTAEYFDGAHTSIGLNNEGYIDNSLNIARIRYDESVKNYSDSTSGFVISQSPEASENIQRQLGSYVEITITVDKTKLESLRNNKKN